MCSVATWTAITSSAPCLIYSQTLIRHMYTNTLRCTSFTPCPHAHTNTFTTTLHLTAASPYSLCISFQPDKPHVSSTFTIQSDVECCQAWFENYLKVLLVGFFCSRSRWARNIWHTFCQRHCLLLLFNCHMTHMSHTCSWQTKVA